MTVMLELDTIAFGGPAVHVAMLGDEAVRRHAAELVGPLDASGSVCS